MDAYSTQCLEGGELLVESLKEFLYLTKIANNWREALIFTGGIPERFEAGSILDILQDNENVLTIQLHNYNYSKIS